MEEETYSFIEHLQYSNDFAKKINASGKFSRLILNTKQ